MIEFGFTGFLFGALTVSVPIVLHMLKRKPTQIQPFPSFQFLKATLAAKQNRNNIFKWLILLLRCLILSLLALAFAWPYLPKFANEPQSTTVLLYDDSLSMQANPYAKELHSKALGLIQQARPDQPIAIGLVSEEVVWNGEFSGNPTQLQSWFQNRTPGEGSSQFERALRDADSRIRNTPGKSKKIIVVTDGQTLPWQDVRLAAKLSPGVVLELITPKSTGFQNISITQSKIITPLSAEKQHLTLIVKSRNHQTTEVQTELITTFHGAIADRRNVVIPPQSEIESMITLESTSLKPQLGHVQLSGSDDLPIDNHSWFCINPIQPPQIFLSPLPPDEKIDFLKIAFAPTPELKRVAIDELKPDTSVEQLKNAGLVILRDLPHPDQWARFDDALRKGARLAVTWKDVQNTRMFLDQYGIQTSIATSPGTRRLENINFDHPVFRPFLKIRIGSLFDILFFNPPSMTFPPDTRTLATFDNDKPAISELKVGEGTLFVIGTEISRASTDWPAHSSFLPFWRELLAYNLNREEKASDLVVSSKPYLTGKVEEATRMTEDKPVKLEGGKWSPTRAGAYLLKTKSGMEAVSVNIPKEESNPLFMNETFHWKELISTEKAPPPEFNPSLTLPAKEGKQYWWILLAFVFLFLLGEVILSNRTAL